MNQYNVEVDILVNGRPVRKYSHQNKTFIASKHWTEYTIRIKNNGHQRRLAVVTVDGLNVVDGDAGAESKAGYVINGYSSYEIRGYRTSNDVVHPFKFNRKGKSYAAHSEASGESTQNCGIIGVQIYAEKEKPFSVIIKEVVREVEKPVPYPVYPRTYPPYWWYRDVYWTTNTIGSSLAGQSSSAPTTLTYSCSLNDAQPTASVNFTNMMVNSSRCEESVPEEPTRGITRSAAPNKKGSLMCAQAEPRGFDTGTEFSDREVTDRVEDVAFEVGVRLCTIDIYYATFEALEEMGVPVTRQAQVAFPESFPTRFCRPPNGSYTKRGLISG